MPLPKTILPTCHLRPIRLANFVLIFTKHRFLTMKKRNDLTLGEAMKAMIKEYQLGNRLNETRVKAIWRERMGKTINTYTSDISVRKNVLYISILSAPLKHELSYAKEKIRTMMNEALEEEYIREVVIS